MSRLKSNSLSMTADAVRMLINESEALALESIDRAIEAGRLLVQAKGECGHGQWLPFLARAGVPERKAQRLMQLARSGLKSDTVSDLGGIKATLEFLAQRKLPKEGHALSVTCHSDEGNPFRSSLAAFVWPSATAGFYYVAGMTNLSPEHPCSTVFTKKPISGDEVLTSDGLFVSPVWTLVERSMRIPPSNWHFYEMDQEVATVVAAALGIEEAS